MFGRSLCLLIASALPLFHTATVHAEIDPASYNAALATRGEASATGLDLLAKLGERNQEARAAALLKRERLFKLMDSVLLTRQLASEGRAMGLEKDPVVQREMELAAEEILANHAMAVKLAEHASGDNSKALEQYALERYTANRQAYEVPPTIRVRHLLVSNEGRNTEEQTQRINELLERAKGGEDFEALVMEYSDDPSRRVNAGIIEIQNPELLDKAFAEAAMKLSVMAPWSEPVRSAFGLHIIRFENRIPGEQRTFEQVKDSLIASLGAQFEERQRQKFMSDLRSADPQYHEEAIEEFLDSLQPAGTSQ